MDARRTLWSNDADLPHTLRMNSICVGTNHMDDSRAEAQEYGEGAEKSKQTLTTSCLRSKWC